MKDIDQNECTDIDGGCLECMVEALIAVLEQVLTIPPM